MLKLGLRHQGVGHVDLPARPARVAEPAEATVHPNPNPAGFAAGVVFLADPGVIDVAQLVVPVEVDQQGAVSDRQVARHSGYYRASIGRETPLLRAVRGALWAGGRGSGLNQPSPPLSS